MKKVLLFFSFIFCSVFFFSMPTDSSCCSTVCCSEYDNSLSIVDYNALRDYQVIQSILNDQMLLGYSFDEDYLFEVFHDSTMLVKVLRKSEQTIGIVAYKFNDMHNVVIFICAINVQYHNQGHGTALKVFLLNEAKIHGGSKITSNF